MGNHSLPTEFGEDDEVLGVALRAGHARRAVAALLLVHPALQARLVHPLGGATAAARPDPLGRAVILVCGKAHPAAPGTKPDTHRWNSGMRLRRQFKIYINEDHLQFLPHNFWIISYIIVFKWLHLTTHLLIYFKW